MFRPLCALFVLTLATLSPAQHLIYERSDAQVGLCSYGMAVCGLGDINGDGYGDWVVGDPALPTLGSNTGGAHVYSGATGTVLTTWLPAAVQAGDRFGSAIANVGDLDGDGVNDAVVGARGHGGGGYLHGAGFVVSGATGSTIHTLLGPQADAGFGDEAVGAAGDVDADGIPDVLVGANGYDGPAGQGLGAVFVYSGATGALIHSLSGVPGDGLGISVAAVGDINLDGHDDFAAGNYAPYAKVYSGLDASLMYTLTDSSVLPSGTLRWCVGGYDLTGDSVPDIAVSYEPQSRVFLFSGADGALASTLQGYSNEDFGSAIAMLPDQTGDGMGEVFVSATSGVLRTLAVYSGLGLGGPVAAYLGVNGRAVASQTDIDGDGDWDLLATEIACTGNFGRCQAYSLGPLPAASVTSVGAPCSNSPWGATLFSSAPRSGAWMTIGVGFGTPGAAGVVYLSPAPAAPTPIGGAPCLLFVDPFAASPIGAVQLDAVGQWQMTTMTPDWAMLLGAQFTAQGAFLGAVTPWGFELTNGLLGAVGL